MIRTVTTNAAVATRRSRQAVRGNLCTSLLHDLNLTRHALNLLLAQADALLDLLRAHVFAGASLRTNVRALGGARL